MAARSSGAAREARSLLVRGNLAHLGTLGFAARLPVPACRMPALGHAGAAPLQSMSHLTRPLPFRYLNVRYDMLSSRRSRSRRFPDSEDAFDPEGVPIQRASRSRGSPDPEGVPIWKAYSIQRIPPIQRAPSARGVLRARGRPGVRGGYDWMRLHPRPLWSSKMSSAEGRPLPTDGAEP